MSSPSQSAPQTLICPPGFEAMAFAARAARIAVKVGPTLALGELSQPLAVLRALGPGQGVADIGALTPATLTLGPLSEPQGESIAYDADGTGVWSVSEDPNQAPGRELHHFLCRP